MASILPKDAELVEPSTLAAMQPVDAASEAEPVDPSSLAHVHPVGGGAEQVDPSSLAGLKPVEDSSEEKRKSIDKITSAEELLSMAATDREAGDNSLLQDYRDRYAVLRAVEDGLPFIDKSGRTVIELAKSLPGAVKSIAESLGTGAGLIANYFSPPIEGDPSNNENVAQAKRDAFSTIVASAQTGILSSADQGQRIGRKLLDQIPALRRTYAQQFEDGLAGRVVTLRAARGQMSEGELPGEVNPEQAESASPVFDPTNVGMAAGGAAVRGLLRRTVTEAAPRVASASLALETAGEAAAKTPRGITNQIAGSAATKTGKALSATAQAVDSSPLARAVLSGTAAVVVGANPGAAILTAAIGANTRRLGLVRGTVGRMGRAMESTGKWLSESPFAGTVGRALDDVAVGTAAGIVGMSPFAFAADTSEDRGRTLATGGAFGGWGAAAGVSANLTARGLHRVGGGFDLANVFEQKDAGVPDSKIPRPEPTSYGHPEFDAAQAQAEAGLSNRGLSVLNALRDLVNKVSDVPVEVHYLDSKNLQKLGETFGTHDAGERAGFHQVVTMPDGSTKRVIGVNADYRGISAGHEPGHVIWDMLKPEEQRAFEDAALKVYGQEGILGFGSRYNRLANDRTVKVRERLVAAMDDARKSGNSAEFLRLQEELKKVGKERDYFEPRRGKLDKWWASDPESRTTKIVQEMFAETVSAYLNGIPFERFGKTGGFGDMIRGKLGTMLEGAGILDAKGYDDVAKTGLGLNPSFTLRGMVENFITARIDETRAGVTKPAAAPASPAATPTPAAAATPATPAPSNGPIKNTRPVQPKPMQKGFKKGDPVDDIYDANGVLVGESARVTKVLDERDGERHYEVEYTHPDTGDRHIGEVPESVLVSKVNPGAVDPDAQVFPRSPVTPDTAPGAATTLKEVPPGREAEYVDSAGRPVTPEQAERARGETKQTAEDIVAPRQVENTTRPQADNPPEAPAKSPNLRATTEQQQQFVKRADKSTTDANVAMLRAMESRPRHERPAVETDYYSAKSPVSNPDQIVREQQRLAADAAERTSGVNPLRALYQKVFVPYSEVRVSADGNPLVYGMSMDKVIGNVDLLRGWLSLNPDAPRAREISDYLSSPQLARDVATYLKNQSRGYRGDGLTLNLPPDARGFTPRDTSYTPTKLDTNSAQLINILMGMEQPGVESTGQAFSARVAEMNGVTPSKIAGVSETNPLRAELRGAGFDPRIMNAAVEQLRIDRMNSPLKERSDLNFPAGDTGVQRAGFMPAPDSFQRGDIFYLPDGQEVEFLRHIDRQRGGAYDGAERAAVRTKPGFELKYVPLEELQKFPPGVDPDRADQKKPAGSMRELISDMEREIQRRRKALQDDFGTDFMPAPGERRTAYDAAEDFSDRYDRHLDSIVKEFESAKDPANWRVSWKTVPASRIKKVWLDYGRTGVVRDEKGMQKIADAVMDGIARLDVANGLSGHDTFDPLEGRFDYFTDAQKEQLQSGLELKDGSWLVSDYGLPYLKKIYDQIFRADTAEEQLFAVDRALNVVHQRGDIAAFFVEGGTKTLNEIATQGGYQTDGVPSHGLARNEALAKPQYMPAPGGQRRAQGNDVTRTIADDYIKRIGLQTEQHARYASIDENRMKGIADWFDSAKHEPDNPVVQSAYRALADETMAQYRAMVDAGIRIEPFSGKGEPYKSSSEMMSDVRDNKHLYFLKTENAFGVDAPAKGNPLLQPSGISINGEPLLVNDVFRAVHDYYGHTAEGFEFGPRGEYNAYLAHSRMFSEGAKPALAAETLAQNSWVNFGSHLRRDDGSLPRPGDKDFVPLKDRRFADQKTTIVPRELLDAAEGRDAPKQAANFMPAPAVDTPEFKSWFGKSKVVDEQGNPRVMYHGTKGNDFSTFDPHIYGDTGLIFTAPDAATVDKFAGSELGSRVYPLFVRAERPFDYRSAADVDALLVRVGKKSFTEQSIRGLKNGDWRFFEDPEVVDAIKELGFDGIWMSEEGAPTLAVFSEGQLKSATGNRGTFDANNPDIRYMPAGDPAYSLLSKDGEVLPVRGGSHAATAHMMLHRDAKTPGEALDRAFSSGYARLAHSGDDLYVDTRGGKLTDKQRSEVENIAIETGKSRVVLDSGDDYRTIWTRDDSADYMPARRRPNALDRAEGDYDLAISELQDARESGDSRRIAIALAAADKARAEVDRVKVARDDQALAQERKIDERRAVEAEARWEEYKKANFMPAPKGQSSVKLEGPKLEHSVDDKVLSLSHYSSEPNLEVIDPSFMSKDSTRKMLKGEPRSFWFVGDSKPNGFTGQSGDAHVYRAKVSGSKMYDMDADPLELWWKPQPQIDKTLQDGGYRGFVAVDDKGRRFAAIYDPIAMTPRGEKQAAARAKQLAKQQKELATPKFEVKPERDYNSEQSAWDNLVAKSEATGRPLYELAAESGVDFMPAPAVETPEFKKWFGDSKVVDEQGKPRTMFHGTLKDVVEFKDSPSGLMYSGLGHWFSSSEGVPNRWADGDGGNVIPAYLSVKNPFVIEPTAEAAARMRQLNDARTALRQTPDWRDAEFTGRQIREMGLTKWRGKALKNSDVLVGEELDGALRFEISDLDPFAQLKSLDSQPTSRAAGARIKEKLNALGYDGVELRNTLADTARGGQPADWVVAFEPTQIKSAIGNRGTFDASNPDIRYMPAPATRDDFTPAKVTDVLKKDDWAVITAENQNAKSQTPAENAAQNAALEAELTQRGFKFEKVVGKYGSVENSYLVFGVTPGQVHDLITRYGQQSGLIPEGFLYRDGTVNKATGVKTFTQEPADFYTKIPGTNTNFAVDIDFDNRVPSATLPPRTSALRILGDDTGLQSPGKQTNAGVAAQIQEAALEANGGRKILSDEITDADVEMLAQNGAKEVLHELKKDGNAGDWYTGKIEDGMAAAAVIHPEIESDALAQATKAGFENAKQAKFGLAVAMAVTSQNLAVPDNVAYAHEQFNILKETGRFDPTKHYGDKGKAISKNLALANEVIELLGWQGAEDFAAKTFTVRDLSREVSKLTGRKITIAGRADDLVQGAAIFGPKIGQGFLQNLLGRLDPVTVDLWFRRTWGRWTGDVLGDGVTAERLARMIDGARELGVKLPRSISSLKVIDEPTKSGTTYRSLTEDAAERFENDVKLHKPIVAFAKQNLKEWNSRYKSLRNGVTPDQAAAFRAGEMTLDQIADANMKLDEKAKQAADEAIVRASIVRRRTGQTLDSLPKPGAEGKEKAFHDIVAQQGRTEFFTNDELSNGKSELTKASKVIVSQLNPIDTPTDADRAAITRVTNRIREIVSEQGIKTTNADIQATLWYPEKDIWAKLRGEKESDLKNSYDEEFLKLAERLGKGDEARGAVERARASRARLAADKGPDASADHAADGSALAGVRVQESRAKRPLEDNQVPGRKAAPLSNLKVAQ